MRAARFRKGSHPTLELGALVLVIGLATPLAAGAPGVAESPSDETVPEGGEMILFQDIHPVFGASKYEQKPIEAPASVTVVSSEEIRTLGLRTLAEVLGGVRGFFITYDRNYSYAGIRGFGRPGDYNSRILLLLDGHRVNDNIFDSALIGTEGIVDLSVVDRIEIVRGPSSSLYGASAFFAVVNIITKSGRDLKGAEVSAWGGSFNTRSGSFSYGNRWPNGLELLVSGSDSKSRGHALYFPEFDGQDGSDGWTGKRDGDATRKIFLKAAFGDFSLEGAFSHRKKDVPTASFGTDFNSKAENTTDDIGYLALRYERDLAGARRVNLELSYNDYYYKGLYPYGGIINYDTAKGQWAGFEGSTIQPLGQHQKVVLGAELRDNLHQDQRNYDVEPRTVYLDSKESSQIWALFVQDEIRLGDRFILNLGARHDHYNTFGGTTNPRLALIWMAGEGTALKLLLGRAFRAPNDYELFYGSVVQKPNPEAGPETIRSAELLLVSSFRGLRATAALYQNRIEGLLGLTVDPTDGLLQYRNIDRARARGLELALNGAFARRFDGRISYSFQDARDGRMNERLTNSPQHLAKASLAAMILQDKLTASLDGQYTSGTRAIDGSPIGASSIFNLGVRYHPWHSGVELGAWVRNLTAARYSNTASEEHVQRLIRQDGRSYRMAASYEF